MKDNILDIVAEDLFSVSPLIVRSIRRKLLRTALEHVREDISPLHFEIMKTLGEAGTLHVTEIGDRLQILKPQMTHLIDKLVSLGMVARQTDARDRRSYNITLTGKGKRMLNKHDKLIKDAIRNTLSSLTSEELEELSVSLRTLSTIFSKLQ